MNGGSRPPKITLDLTDSASIDAAVAWALKWIVGALNSKQTFAISFGNTQYASRDVSTHLDLFFRRLEGNMRQRIFPSLPFGRRFKFYGTSKSSTIFLEILATDERDWNGPFCEGFECYEPRKSEVVRVTTVMQLLGIVRDSTSDYEGWIARQIPTQFVYGNPSGIQETEYFRFKTATSKYGLEDRICDESIIDISALSNYWGGYIFWGITAHGTVEGCAAADVKLLRTKLAEKCSQKLFPHCGEFVSVARCDVQGLITDSTAEKRFIYAIRVRALPGKLVLLRKPLAFKAVVRGNRFCLEDFSPNDCHEQFVSTLRTILADGRSPRIEKSDIIPAKYQGWDEAPRQLWSDGISALKEYGDKTGHWPRYTTTTTGPSHMPTFFVTVECNGHTASGSGSVKREAEHDAARNWLREHLGLAL